jgi:hypothetical protein
MTSNEFGIGIFWNVDNDGLWENNLNVSSRYVDVRRFCCAILADVYYNEYMIGCF